LYWIKHLIQKNVRQMKELEELNSVDRKGCEELEGIEVIFDIRKILELKY